MRNKRPDAEGRGSQSNPPNRFGGPVHVLDLAEVEHDEEYLESLGKRPTEYLPDHSKSIVTKNDSPDVGFRYSLNPYRGCSHGCSYCYARPSHEFLGLSAGLDFETKIFVKERAAELFREFLAQDSWQPEPIAMAGVPVGVCIAPVIPGLNDSEIPALLAAAKQAGAQQAMYILLRLPLTVAPVFEEWLERTFPNQRERILGRIRSSRGGRLNDS